MVALIRAAQRGAHEVVVSSGRDMSEVISRLGVGVHSSGITLAESYARMPGEAMISQMPPEEQSGFAARHLSGAGAMDRARDLVDLVETWPPDLIVHDAVELGSVVAAEANGIQHVTHGYGPMVPANAQLVAAIGSAIHAAGVSDPCLRCSLRPTLTSPHRDYAGRGQVPGAWSARCVHPLARSDRTPA